MAGRNISISLSGSVYVQLYINYFNAWRREECSDGSGTVNVVGISSQPPPPLSANTAIMVHLFSNFSNLVELFYFWQVEDVPI